MIYHFLDRILIEYLYWSEIFWQRIDSYRLWSLWGSVVVTIRRGMVKKNHWRSLCSRRTLCGNRGQEWNGNLFNRVVENSPLCSVRYLTPSFFTICFSHVIRMDDEKCWDKWEGVGFGQVVVVDRSQPVYQPLLTFF